MVACRRKKVYQKTDLYYLISPKSIHKFQQRISRKRCNSDCIHLGKDMGCCENSIESMNDWKHLVRLGFSETTLLNEISTGFLSPFIACDYSFERWSWTMIYTFGNIFTVELLIFQTIFLEMFWPFRQNFNCYEMFLIILFCSWIAI